MILNPINMHSMPSESRVASSQAKVVIARDVARVFPSHPRTQQVRLEIAEVLRNYARQAQRRSKCNDAVNAHCLQKNSSATQTC